MKKSALLLCLLMVLMLSLTACGECDHKWKAASCEKAKTCTLCNETEGVPLGHDWQAATCEKPQTCGVCQKTNGTTLEHTWQDATCTTSKTCTVCNATEGNPKPHEMKAANFQESATCVVCGHTEGEQLAAAYDAYSVKVIDVELGVAYDYETACYVKGHTTIGKLTWENYRVFESDETHEAVEGYVWHSVTVTILFSDRNAQKYGFIVQSALDDYYWVASENGNGYTDQFTVSYRGALYDQCLMANGYGSVSEWVDDACTYTAEFAWRVPVGYDGHMILFYNAEEDLGELLRNGDASVLIFRFTE